MRLTRKKSGDDTPAEFEPSFHAVADWLKGQGITDPDTADLDRARAELVNHARAEADAAAEAAAEAERQYQASLCQVCRSAPASTVDLNALLYAHTPRALGLAPLTSALEPQGVRCCQGCVPLIHLEAIKALAARSSAGPDGTVTYGDRATRVIARVIANGWPKAADASWRTSPGPAGPSLGPNGFPIGTIVSSNGEPMGAIRGSDADRAGLRTVGAIEERPIGARVRDRSGATNGNPE